MIHTWFIQSDSAVLNLKHLIHFYLSNDTETENVLIVLLIWAEVLLLGCQVSLIVCYF